MASYLLPSLRQALAEGQDCEMLMLAVAGWFRYLRGIDEDGLEIDVQDPLKDLLQTLAQVGGNDAGVLLRGSQLFGNLDQEIDFVNELTVMLTEIDQHGVRTVLDLALVRSEAMSA